MESYPVKKTSQKETARWSSYYKNNAQNTSTITSWNQMKTGFTRIIISAKRCFIRATSILLRKEMKNWHYQLREKLNIPSKYVFTRSIPTKIPMSFHFFHLNQLLKLQSFTKYLRKTIVFMWNTALRKKNSLSIFHEIFASTDIP